MLPKHPFEAFNIALALIRSLRPLLAQIRQHDKKLASQMEDAANSIGLNLCEGRQRIGRDRLHFWRIAGGSTDEVRAGLYMSEAWGHVASENLAQALELTDRLIAITWKLTH